MRALRRCWWCGREAEVDTSLRRDSGLIRDDSASDGSESWICTPDQVAECVRQARTSPHGWQRLAQE
jgi:hypothetical protein